MIAVALLLAAQNRAPAGCGMLVDQPPHMVSCMRRERPDATPITGPARLCGRHFAVTLRSGDVFISSGDASHTTHVLTMRDARTIRFGDEMFAAAHDQAFAGARGPTPGRDDLRVSAIEGSSHMPYTLRERRGRYVLPAIDGSALDGTGRDAVPLARLAARTPATRCDRTIDLGTIGYSDDPDFSTMAAR